MNADILDKVINALINSNISNYRISIDTGISDETIANYRKGKSKPRGANLKVLSKYLGINKDNDTSEIVSEDNITLDLNMDAKDVIIKALTEKIQRLESENAELRCKCEPLEERPGA